MQRSHYPYQAAVGPSHTDYPVRNPWVDKHPDSSSSSASRSGRRRPAVYRPGPPPASDWLRPQLPQARIHGPILNQIVQPRQRHSLQGSSPGESTAGANQASDNCAKCDSFCYHCLQVVYIAGILTGVSLTIAGTVLRGNPRRGDLLVLVYIGVLLAAVCTLLLSVHYCVRKSVKERKRQLRGGVRVIPTTPVPEISIPMQRIPAEDDYRINTLPQPSMTRSRSSHSSHGRRYYMPEQRPPPPEWDRQPYQPLIHRPVPR